ncbi:MAG: glutamine amidotransferase, partial [Planctomycetia bacterium]|nr:glutamine amidotransferase [Planctomycetia bacterium]
SLNRVLQTDPNVEAVSLVQIRPGGKFTQLGGAGKTRAVGFPQTAEEMDKFDVFIIGSLDRTYMSANQMKILKEAVREGKGLLMLGGQTSFGPGGYQGTPIEEILPVQVGPRSIGQEMSLFVMKLTAEGANHLIFSGVQKFFQGGLAEGTKPLLTGCVVLGAPKPGASILAVHPERKGPAGGNLIVLAVHQYGDGRTAAFAGDTTWRWDIPLKALGRESPYVKFWGQMVRWLAGRDVKERSTEPGVDLVLRKPMYDLGDTVSVKAQVREAEGRATNFADIISTVIAPNQGRIALNLGNVPGAVGLYEGEFVVEEPGAYRVVVEARKDGVRLGLAQADFTVGRPDAEFERLGTDIKVLQEIADISKGRLFAPANFGDIIDFLGTKEISEEQHREVKLYHLPTMFFVFLALITTEWLIRRYHQLN